MSLGILYVGSIFRLLRMSWYKLMKLFQTDLKLVIDFFCALNDDFHGVDYSPNDVILM